MSGEISLCPHQNCNFVCCTFNQGNYIVLYPGEHEANSQAVGHLEIIDEDYFGGKRAVCHAADTGTCDNGYKPLDCASYPFFPKPGAQGELQLIRGSKCPLPTAKLEGHRRWVKRKWAALSLEEFLAKVEMVGYELVTEPLSPEPLVEKFAKELGSSSPERGLVEHSLVEHDALPHVILPPGLLTSGAGSPQPGIGD